MRSLAQNQALLGTAQISKKFTPNEFLSFIRSRLNNMVTSLYLLEVSLEKIDRDQEKYFDKIKEELEIIRQQINA